MKPANSTKSVRAQMHGHSRVTLMEFLLISSCLLLWTFSPMAAAESADEQQQQQQLEDGVEDNAVEMEEKATTTPSSDPSKSCDIHQNEALHVLMDRICELCHDMYSHQQPNMRADCRSECFRNSHFKKCLRLFKPAGRSGAQRRKLRFMAEALDALILME